MSTPEFKIYVLFIKYYIYYGPLIRSVFVLRLAEMIFRRIGKGTISEKKQNAGIRACVSLFIYDLQQKAIPQRQEDLIQSPQRAFIISPAIISPATPGTNGTEAGVRGSPESGSSGFSGEKTHFTPVIPRFLSSYSMTRASGQTDV